jgi:hypothetical protein
MPIMPPIVASLPSCLSDPPKQYALPQALVPPIYHMRMSTMDSYLVMMGVVNNKFKKVLPQLMTCPLLTLILIRHCLS